MFAASKTSAVIAAAPSTDPQFNYVTMLLHGDGTNGAQNNTFVDSSTNNFTITRNGTPTQGSFSPYGDLWSNQFNGSSSFAYPSGTTNNFGTSNFTVEAWIYLAEAGNRQKVIDSRTTTNTTSWHFGFGPSTAGLFGWSTGTVNFEASLPAGINSWAHVAYTRSGTTYRLFCNGVQIATGTDSTNYTGSGTTATVGNRYATSAGFPWNGYISNLRIVVGTALYTSNFTPSTTPLTAVSGTSLLTCQSNRFRDNSSNNFAITVTGTPSVQRFSPFDPAAEYSTSVIGGSGFMTGTQYLLLGGQSAFSFDADFTVELWFYALGAGTGTPKLYESRGSGQEGVYVTIEHSGTSLVFRMSSAARITTTFAYNTWNHVALVRSSGVITMYLNGVSAGTYSTSATTLIGTSRPCIGAYPGFDNLNGYVSNLRVVKGTAVYTSAFTPPTAPLTAITNTSLLLNTVNAGIYDNAMMNDLVTVGDAQISTAVVKYGTGSMKFDGTGDCLTTPDVGLFDFGTGDFTVEGWIYPTAFITDGNSIASGLGPTNGDWMMALRSSTQLSWGRNHLAWDATTSGVTFSLNTWYHVAVTKSSGTLRIFVDGVQRASVSNSQSYNVQTSLAVGARQATFSVFGPGEYFNGYIDDLRITKGVARYTANFTPPTAAFPNN